MAFTQIPDKSTGDVFTEELWDTIKDNVNKGVMRPVADSTLGASATTITLSSIAADYAHLLLVVHGRGTVVGTTTNLYVRFNADSGSNYDWQNHQGANTTLSAAEALAAAQIASLGFPGSTGTANRYGAVEIWIPGYANTSFNKTAIVRQGRFYDATAANFATQIVGGNWRSSSAITSITLALSTGDFASGTRTTLYGLGVAA